MAFTVDLDRLWLDSSLSSHIFVVVASAISKYVACRGNENKLDFAGYVPECGPVVSKKCCPEDSAHGIRSKGPMTLKKNLFKNIITLKIVYAFSEKKPWDNFILE